MLRPLYRCLVRLHPRMFRDRFGGEMLWIFEEAAACGGAAALFADGLRSLFRQWLLRSDAWKMAAGGAVSFVFICGMLGAAAIRPASHRIVALPPPHCPAPCAPADFTGHWSGNFHWPAPAGQVEIVFTPQGGSWSGELQVQGPDGIAHRGVAENLRFDGGAVTFQVKTAFGPMRFYGWMAQGKLTGALEPAREAAF